MPAKVLLVLSMPQLRPVEGAENAREVLDDFTHYDNLQASMLHYIITTQTTRSHAICCVYIITL